ncbi:thiamine-phosphate kinase [Candidatus Planktophila dulcis]|uniref:thiamine-phosphate kinase n=1 Tax=Candidatus Planktophila dulcis TaxID=1884914 RepID=UPI003CF94A07
MGLVEREVVTALQKIFATADPRLKVGIGDDAAVVKTQSQSIITSDMAVEDVHFKLEWSSAFDIGRKITAANVADILSMGGKCDFLTASVALTGNETMQWIENLARGMKHEADAAGALIVGGDIARGPKIVISMTAVGSAQSPILRSGAKVGDGLYLSSLTGWSAAGLELLTREVSINSSIAERALSEFSAPTLDYACDFSKATAMADVSDSVLIQAEQIAEASGVQLVLDQSLISQAGEFAELSSLADELKVDVFQWILAGGEDHVLLATGVNLPGIRIGSVLAGSGVSGVEMKKAPVSWSHFQ